MDVYFYEHKINNCGAHSVMHISNVQFHLELLREGEKMQVSLTMVKSEFDSTLLGLVSSAPKI